MLRAVRAWARFCVQRVFRAVVRVIWIPAPGDLAGGENQELKQGFREGDEKSTDNSHYPGRRMLHSLCGRCIPASPGESAKSHPQTQTHTFNTAIFPY